jgi:hypothetical protein
LLGPWHGRSSKKSLRTCITAATIVRPAYPARKTLVAGWLSERIQNCATGSCSS